MIVGCGEGAPETVGVALGTSDIVGPNVMGANVGSRASSVGVGAKELVENDVGAAEALKVGGEDGTVVVSFEDGVPVGVLVVKSEGCAVSVGATVGCITNVGSAVVGTSVGSGKGGDEGSRVGCFVGSIGD